MQRLCMYISISEVQQTQAGQTRCSIVPAFQASGDTCSRTTHHPTPTQPCILYPPDRLRCLRMRMAGSQAHTTVSVTPHARVMTGAPATAAHPPPALAVESRARLVSGREGSAPWCDRPDRPDDRWRAGRCGEDEDEAEVEELAEVVDGPELSGPLLAYPKAPHSGQGRAVAVPPVAAETAAAAE